jgi:hypothetical protein
MITDDDLKPRPPLRSKKAAKWRAYYAGTARWFEMRAQSLKASYPRAAAYAADEARRFQAGAALIDAGRHENQTAGVWK